MSARAAVCGVLLCLGCVSLPAGRRAPKADCIAAVDDQDRLCAANGPGCTLEPAPQCGNLDPVVFCECRCPGAREDPCPEGAR